MMMTLNPSAGVISPQLTSMLSMSRYASEIDYMRFLKLVDDGCLLWLGCYCALRASMQERAIILGPVEFAIFEQAIRDKYCDACGVSTSSRAMPDVPGQSVRLLRLLDKLESNCMPELACWCAVEADVRALNAWLGPYRFEETVSRLCESCGLSTGEPLTPPISPPTITKDKPKACPLPDAAEYD